VRSSHARSAWPVRHTFGAVLASRTSTGWIAILEEVFRNGDLIDRRCSICQDSEENRMALL
jgi:hypothetical protein